MKLTAEDVAKATKLSLATVRAYAAKRKIGTRQGKQKFFTKADLKKFTGPASTSKRASKPKRVKPKAKLATKATLKAKTVAAPVAPSQPAPKPQRRSFWDFFMNKRPQKKVSILDLQQRDRTKG